MSFLKAIRAALPESNIFEIYADMRAYGKGCEEFYALTTHKQIIFLMYDQQEQLPVIRQADRNERNRSKRRVICFQVAERLHQRSPIVPLGTDHHLRVKMDFVRPGEAQQRRNRPYLLAPEHARAQLRIGRKRQGVAVRGFRRSCHVYLLSLCAE